MLTARAETVDVVAQANGVEVLDAPALLPDVPAAASRLDPRFIQLWPHIHGTDAMFCALLRRIDAPGVPEACAPVSSDTWP